MSVPSALVRQGLLRARPIRVRVPRAVGEWFSDSFGARGARLPRSLKMGRYLRPASPELPTLGPVVAGATAMRHTFQRHTLPIYTGFRLETRSVEIELPGRIEFEWSNPEAIPYGYRIAIHPAHRYSTQNEWSAKMGMPQLQSVVTGSVPPRDNRERNRRRHDDKVPASYMRMLALANRTYGPVSEYLEVVDAWQNNMGRPDAFVAALALNQAADRAIGERESWVRKNVYQSGYWPFPVGYSALRNRWGLF